MTPKSSDTIQADDILIFVGDEGSKAKVEALVNAQTK